MDNFYNNPYGTYSNGYENYDSDIEQKNKASSSSAVPVQKPMPPVQQQPTPPPENMEDIQIKIDRKGKGHEKKDSMNYGFIGSTSTTKYSNPYDNNVYGEFPPTPTTPTPKKEKRNSKRPNKKRNSSEILPGDADVTQAGSSTPAVVGTPVVYYTTPTVGTPVVGTPAVGTPAMYYTTPVAAPVAIQYVNSPSLTPQSETPKDKEKRESRRYTSYYGDKENAEEDIVKSKDKEKEYQEIMNELGMKPKDDKPKDFKSRLIQNQLCILITCLVLFVLLIVLYFIWPRVPDITVKEFELQEQDGIQYKFPMSIEYRDEYVDLNNITSSDVDSFMRFNLITHFDVRNNNYLPYKFQSLNLDYILKGDYLKNNVFLGRSFVNDIKFAARKNTHMTITTTLEYSAQSMKKDDTFRYLLEKCGITGPGSNMDIEYKIAVKIPVISTIYHPSYTKETEFECPFLKDEKYKVIEKKEEEEEHHDDENGDEEHHSDDSKHNDDDSSNHSDSNSSNSDSSSSSNSDSSSSSHNDDGEHHD